MVSEETKKKISIARKLWLAANPEKHPWKNPDKANSPPCENVKRILRLKEIDFLPEFSPGVVGRFFSVDIAFPDRRIIWEINGNQHYEKDGTLKPYYQERHDLLVADGWTVYEILSKYCFNEEKIGEFISLSLNSPIKIEFDYFSYMTPSKKTRICPDCGEKKGRNAIRCLACKRIHDKKYGVVRKKPKSPPKKRVSKPKPPRPKKEPKVKPVSLCPNCDRPKSKIAEWCRSCNSRKEKKKWIEWPSVEEMKSLIFSMPTSQLGLQLGVSDSAIGKFCKTHGIDKPGRGYWAKERSGIGTQN
jgi:very-short-patch-repair endonuclease